MVMVIQVLERGVNHIVCEIRGTELQEMTVCHAEEINAINDESKASFEEKKFKVKPGYALSPLTDLRLMNYDDVKISLTGVIENKEFAELLKANFMRSLAYEFT